MTYDHLLGRNPYISKRPKRQQRAFPLALLSLALVGVLLALVEKIGMNKTVRDSGLLDSEIVGVCPYQKGSSSVLILLSNGSYSSITPLRVSV